jgi:hypothetical protein
MSDAWIEMAPGSRLEDDLDRYTDYWAIAAEQAKSCRCKYGPCDGVLAGGECEEVDLDKETDQCQKH